MDVRRYFLGPLAALLVVGLLFFFVDRYASSGTAFRQAKLPDVIALIDKGQVRSARLFEPDHVLQVTTSGPRPQHLQASWAGHQGPALARELQEDHNSGRLPRVYTMAATGGLLGILVGILPCAVVILIIFGVFVSVLRLLLRRRSRT